MYENLIEIRDYPVDGVDKWHWIKEDHGAWDGPMKEWISANKEKYTKYSKEKRVVIQAGGNCGLYPRLLSNIFDVVYTFEPDPLNFYCLALNCQKDNIVKFQAPLWINHTMMKMERANMANVGMHKVNEGGYLHSMMIDDLELPYLDMIQLDTEGSEHSILQGAVKNIEKFKPLIVVESTNPSIEDLLINQFGYRELERSYADTFYQYQ